MTGSVVIGVSGSEHAHPALAWGVAYALDHQLRVELVHVVDNTWGALADSYTEDAIVAAERKLMLERDRVSSNHPSLAVHAAVLVGSPDRQLVEHAKGAELLVVGSHPIERFGDQVFSHRAARVAERAQCSVVIAPAAQDDTHGVVVGVDGSEISARAIRFAAEIADRWNEPLTAVHAWTPPWLWDADPGMWPDAPAPEDEALLAGSIAGLAEDYPGLEVDRKLPSARPADALYGASIRSKLLVVGSHGRQGIERALFGSVSAELVLSMPCPVAIVR